jgi:hypothetical protein
MAEKAANSHGHRKTPKKKRRIAMYKKTTPT